MAMSSFDTGNQNINKTCSKTTTFKRNKKEQLVGEVVCGTKALQCKEDTKRATKNWRFDISRNTMRVPTAAAQNQDTTPKNQKPSSFICFQLRLIVSIVSVSYSIWAITATPAKPRTAKELTLIPAAALPLSPLPLELLPVELLPLELPVAVGFELA